MKTNTKIMIGFVAIIILTLVQTLITHITQTDILKENYEIRDIEAPLGIMSEQVIGYDGILTGQVHAALLHAQKGEYNLVKEHKERYDEIGIKLGDLLKKDAKMLIAQSPRSAEERKESEAYINKLDEINVELVDLETKAFAAIENKDADAAYPLIVGGNYDNYKRELYENYRAWADLEHRIISDMRKDVLEDSQRLIYMNFIFSIIISSLIIITLSIIRSFVTERYKSYKSLYDTSNDALMTLEPPDWKFTSGNHAAIKMFNVKDEKQFLSFHPEDLSPKKQPDGQPSSVKAMKMIMKAMKEGSNFFKWTHKRYKGKSFRANVLLSKVKDEAKTYLEATVRKDK